jgi:hypothetical protein
MVLLNLLQCGNWRISNTISTLDRCD